MNNLKGVVKPENSEEVLPLEKSKEFTMNVE